MTIRVNGEHVEVAGPVSIGALLAGLNIDPRRVAVEHNLLVVKRDRYDSTIVQAGDAIEIVNFVGGGGDDGGGAQCRVQGAVCGALGIVHAPALCSVHVHGTCTAHVHFVLE